MFSRRKTYSKFLLKYMKIQLHQHLLTVWTHFPRTRFKVFLIIQIFDTTSSIIYKCLLLHPHEIFKHSVKVFFFVHIWWNIFSSTIVSRCIAVWYFFSQLFTTLSAYFDEGNRVGIFDNTEGMLSNKFLLMIFSLLIIKLF